MKITDYKTFSINAGYRNLIFVIVYTDKGIHGVGEATLEWKTHATLGAFEDLRPYVIGTDPTRFERLFYECYRQSYWRVDPCYLSAIAALEMACVDITGKAYNMPAYQLFGGKLHDKLRIYTNGWSGSAATPGEYAQNAAIAVENGAKALKWDFFGSSYMTITHEAFDKAVSIMAAVREAVGPGIELLIEGHGRFNPHIALKIANAMAEYKPYFFEEPVITDVVEDTIEVHKYSPIPIAAGERLFGKSMFRELLSQKGVDFAQPDLMHIGGMNELKKIAVMAEVQNIQIAPHNPGSSISTAANIQVCATLPNFEFLEMLNDVPYRTEITTENLQIEDGFLIVQDTPGLGIDIVAEECLKYPMKSSPQRMFGYNYS
ncbi:MAG: mandelate racemase/muconate lactonizing enzyme family protein [Oscillospiraceae bacterium]|nr:mandelate racemase/muconate lactonizing enzyme family protein [Oscillospiraceae bacterium]